jgi:hypothetical protein
VERGIIVKLAKKDQLILCQVFGQGFQAGDLPFFAFRIR